MANLKRQPPRDVQLLRRVHVKDHLQAHNALEPQTREAFRRALQDHHLGAQGSHLSWVTRGEEVRLCLGAIQTSGDLANFLDLDGRDSSMTLQGGLAQVMTPAGLLPSTPTKVRPPCRISDSSAQWTRVYVLGLVVTACECGRPQAVSLYLPHHLFNREL